MEVLKQNLDKELSLFVQQLPVSDGSVLGLKDRLQFVLDSKEEYLKKINEIGNKFVSENNFNSEEIESIKELCKQNVTAYLGSFSS